MASNTRTTEEFHNAESSMTWWYNPRYNIKDNAGFSSAHYATWFYKTINSICVMMIWIYDDRHYNKIRMRIEHYERGPYLSHGGGWIGNSFREAPQWIINETYTKWHRLDDGYINNEEWELCQKDPVSFIVLKQI